MRIQCLVVPLFTLFLASSVGAPTEQQQHKQYDISDYDKKQIECLAKNVYFEARGENKSGQIAVANVIMNRTKHKSFPSSVCGVVRQKNQFYFESLNIKPQIIETATYDSILDISKKVYFDNKSITDNTKGSLYFHDKKIQKPEWTTNLVYVASIGNHKFYR